MARVRSPRDRIPSSKQRHRTLFAIWPCAKGMTLTGMVARPGPARYAGEALWVWTQRAAVCPEKTQLLRCVFYGSKNPRDVLSRCGRQVQNGPPGKAGEGVFRECAWERESSTAGILVIVDEILSGRTKDKNRFYRGIPHQFGNRPEGEVRLVADEHRTSFAGLDALRPPR